MTEIVARGLETCLTEAFQIATSDCSAIARRRKDEAEGTRWDPSQPLLEGRKVDERLRVIAEGEEARRRGAGTARPHGH